MLTYIVEDQVPQLSIDIVRMTPDHFQTIRRECSSEEGIRCGAFIAQYDWHSAVLLHRGTELEHKAFAQRLNSLL